MKHTKFRRHAFFATLAVLWALGIVVTFAWFRLARSDARPEAPVQVAGLGDSVVVRFDTLGIPTIRARTELDAWRALGYVHATERLWQLEFLRRIATGRLSELFGEQALQTDRFVRTLGLGRIAGDGVDRLGADERQALEAYASGVNARIAEGGPWPPEFQILRFEPAAWTPEATLGVAMVMNLDLSHWSRDLSRWWAAGHLPPAKAAYLHPRYPEWGPRTLDGGWRPPAATVTGFEAAAAGTAGDAAGGAEGPVAGRGASPPGSWDPIELLASVSIRVASNAWVVGPDRTLGGHPILANDMHLALRVPSIWYVAALHAEEDGLHVAGFTLPGVPGVVAGFNRSVAWGATNAMVDDMDFAIETVDDTGRRYREGDAWRAFELRPDTIEVRGGPTVVDTVRSTVRGPVISDVLSDVDGTLSAIFLPDHIPVGIGGLFAMNRARSLEEFHVAASDFRQPHLNLVIASADGRIGYHLAGSIPLRRWDGALPAPAAVVGDGWAGTWPPEDHPSATDPERDFLVTANNLQADGLDGAIGADWPIPFRALRITQLLSVRRDWTVAATADLQRDVRSLLADRTIGRAIDAARRIGETAAADTLAAWDRMVDVDSHAAPIFYAWFYGLRSMVAADEWAAAPDRALFPTISMLRVLEEGDVSPWVDDVSTPDHVETLPELEERAMAQAIERVGGRRWGDLHQERNTHPLGTQPWLDRLFGFNVGPYPSPGGPNTVRPDAYMMWQQLSPEGPTPPWTSEYGPSERLVVEMTPDGPRGHVILPTGESGNPFNPHYRDMNRAWREGELADLSLDAEPADGATLETLETIVLIPETR
ncbi:MAG: penicillin acylase family protein [Gemmatimonadales bacterium]|jgi:penicillin amidase